MIIVKNRNKSNYLCAVEALDKRMTLPDEEALHLLNMQKGFKGEVLFDSLLEEFLNVEALILNDLMFTEKGSTFQVDSLILTGEKVLLFEVKNYEGNFQFKSHHLLTSSGKEIGNPLNQLDDTSIKMRQLLSKWNVNLTFDPILIFVNPAFTLYNAPSGSPIIFPTQIKEQLSRMNRIALPLSKRHHHFADKMMEENQEEAAFQRKLPSYTYDLLKKGLWCIECGSPDLSNTQRTISCRACGSKATVEDTVSRQIKDFKLLFPDSKVTSAAMFDWLGSTISTERIRKILLKNYKTCGATYGSYYE
ncbi:nuclease-related domain-containing protein [Carnobacterium alterfunditum]|uniref:nuclease-related domain-containing protein n=1 Tax=Carnobacterium alterfunditum TaxID=28230 RepID=UPI0035932A19